MKHSIEQVHHTIEMDESMGLHKTGWAIQRVGWTVLFTLVVMAALGLFGSGVLSRRTKEASGNMVEYERYGRFENSTYMHLKALAENGKAILIIPQQYLKHFELEAIVPEPDKQHAVEGHQVFTFLAEAPVHIMVRGIPKKTGPLETTVRINNTNFDLSQYIFP
jgi:hypothetical protein